MADDCKALSIRVAGRVQGVGFRIWTRDEARRLGLSGWVRNEADGSVMVLAAGSSAALAALVDRLRKGPSGSHVDGLVSEEINPATIGGEFSIRD